MNDDEHKLRLDAPVPIPTGGQPFTLALLLAGGISGAAIGAGIVALMAQMQFNLLGKSLCILKEPTTASDDPCDQQ